MQAVLLVGGFGTRLAHVVKDVPKPMAPINDVPFLKYIYDLLISNGVDNFIFLTGYLSEKIEEYFKDYSNIRFIKEFTPLGTGGALLNAYDYLEDQFFFVNGDTFFDIDLSILLNFSKDKPFSMALRFTDNIERYGFVQLKSDSSYRISNFIEKGKLPKDVIDGYINGGIYCIKKCILNNFLSDFNNQNISFENNIIPKLVQAKIAFGLPLGGAFIDIGIPEDYQKAQMLIPYTLSAVKRPALFIDKDGTLIVDNGYTHGKEINVIDATVQIVKEYKEKGFYVVIVTNQAGIAKGKFTLQSMLDNINSIKKTYASIGIHFDDIEYCCYHSDGIIPQYAYSSLARKPYPGMLLKACEKLRIDMKNSVMIGDNEKTDKILLPYLKSQILANK